LSSSTFASLGTPADLVERLSRHGISEPFPIQAATVPDALAGRDICGRAPTGSGKTIAFGIPLVSRLDGRSRRSPRGLVLVPTRELAAQVTTELRMLAGPKGPSVLAVYGGVGYGPQLNQLRRGVDILVACPGRLSDLVRRGDVTLDSIEIVVIDEADRMADMGFLPEVRRLLDTVPGERQTLLFSATLDGDVDVLVRRYQRNPVRHELEPEHTAHSSRHVFWNTARADRVAVLTDLLATQWPAIVFCRTKHGADRLAKQLGRAGIASAAIHGNLSQSQRTRALAAFAGGTVHALVATDVAARGIHVDDVAVVVHFDPPATEKDYVHRSGRTGRAGRTGIVVSFVDRDQQKATAVLQRQLGLDGAIERPDVADLHQPRRQPRPATRTHRAPSSPARARTRGARRVRRAR
jgi:superfamily II DNA/RNA helicase